MSTHDYSLSNQSGASFRSDLNNALAAILSNNSNGSAPSTTVAYSIWADTTSGKLKIRNSANDAFVDLINLDGTIARDLTLTGASANIVFDQSDNALEFADNAKATFGTGADLTISHDGGNSIINDSGTGELKLQRGGNTMVALNATGIEITDPDGTGRVTITGFESSNAQIYLAADEGDDNGDTWAIQSTASTNVFRFLNDTSGSQVTKWTMTTDGDVTQTGHLLLPDSKQLRLGGGNDLTLEHDGSNSIINDNGTGELQIKRAGNTILSLNSTGIEITDPSAAAEVTITGFEGNNAQLVLQADEGDDDADKWRIRNVASTNMFKIENFSTGSYVAALTADTSGNIGLGGATTPASLLNIQKNDSTAYDATAADGQIGVGPTLYLLNGQNTQTGVCQIVFGMRSTEEQVRIVATGGTGESLRFVLDDEEFFHFDNAGRLTLTAGTNSYNSNGYLRVPVGGSSLGAWVSNSGSTSARKHMRFENPNNTVGSISTSASATTFATSSDYRLKENVVAISDGITRLKTLKPSRFNWKADATVTVDGFLAHEVTAVPEAIVGTKDEVVTQAMIDAGDYDSTKLNDPIYQEIDQSKIVPLLTAALQEAVGKIETLETKVAALEAA